ncbi:hypothetical protein BRC90_00950 [Halobacteriales archaeon QS_4_69_34]|nr:MAG: hypothetical protein BRC90_00950 [Halobacteriales archaeon QS_4_69_34]
MGYVPLSLVGVAPEGVSESGTTAGRFPLRPIRSIGTSGAIGSLETAAGTDRQLRRAGATE